MAARKKVDDTLIRQWVGEGLTNAQIAARLDISEYTVGRRKVELNLCYKSGRFFIDRAVFESLWSRKVPVPQIARQFGVSMNTVYNVANRFGLQSYKAQERQTEARRRDRNRQPPQTAQKPQPAGVAGDVLATGGKWAGLAVVAAKHGMTLAQVQREFHLARASV